MLITAILVLLAIEGAIWLLERQSQPPPTYVFKSADPILDAIAELDSRFEKGKITDEAYKSERALLKAEATKLLNIEQLGGGST